MLLINMCTVHSSVRSRHLEVMWVRQKWQATETREGRESSLFPRVPCSLLRPYDLQAPATQVKCTEKRWSIMSRK